MLFLRRSPRGAYLTAVLGSGAILAINPLLEDPTRSLLVTVLYIFTVLGAGALGGWRPSLVAIGLSILGYWFLFVEPYFSFWRPDPMEFTTLLAYVIVGGALSLLTEGLQRSGTRLEERQQRLELEVGQHQRARAALEKAEARSRAEAERSHASAALLRVTLASIGDGVITTDAQGRVTFMNSIAEALTGWSSSEAEGRLLSDVFHIVNERTRAGVANPCEKVLSSGAIVGLANHTILIARHGTEVPIDDSAAPIRDDAGRILGVVLVFRDASKEREATQALGRLAAIVESSHDAMISKSIDGTITSWNAGAERLYGYMAQEAIGSGVEMIVPPERKDEFRQLMERLRRGKRIEQLDTVRRRKDGSLVDVSLQIAPISNREGDITGASTVARDITERKRSEQALAFLAEISRTLAAITDRESALVRATRMLVPFFADWCIICMVTDDGGIQPATYAHRDPEKEELVGQLLARSPLDWNTDLATVRALRTGTTQFVAEVPEGQLRQVARSDDDFSRIASLEPRSVISAPLRIRSRTVATITFVATDARRRYTSADVGLAEELAFRVATAIDNAELLESARAADRQKDEFLAMLAHELRNPLGAISYASTLMQVSPADALPELIDVVHRQVGNLAHLIDDLLDVSRISRGKIQLRTEAIDAATIVRRAVAAARPLIEGKSHTLTLAIQDGPMPLLVDGTRVEQILVNFLTNAAKYTPDGGSISLGAEAQQGEAVIRVKDTGVGIPAEMLPRVFELFAQADRTIDRSQGGLGIGLTVARRLAELHGGTVTADSDGIGKGAEFTLRLPLCETPAEPSAGAVASRDPSAVKLRILIVDDNHDTAKMEALLLSNLGHEVATAFDGLGVLEAARTFRPDVILLDIGLPGLDGYGVAKQLREEGMDSVVLVAVSGYGRLDDVQRSRDAGFNHHLVKPVEQQALVEMLNEIPSTSNAAAL
jgi:PAS domain S-box-containing protein